MAITSVNTDKTLRRREKTNDNCAKGAPIAKQKNAIDVWNVLRSFFKIRHVMQDSLRDALLLLGLLFFLITGKNGKGISF